MGNNNSRTFESLNPENYEDARFVTNGFSTTVEFPVDSKPNSLSDDKLWQEFGKEISELLPLLNKHLYTVFFVTFLLILIIWAMMAARVVPSGGGGSADEGPNVYIVITFLVAMIFTFGANSIILRRNGEVDEQIHKVCANYTRRFQEHGIVPQYRTKFTGFWKPKRAMPLRMIVFIPAGNLSA